MKDLLVWYYVIGSRSTTGSLHLTILHNSIAYTIAELESRNTVREGEKLLQGYTITHYMNENNEIIDVKTSMTYIPKHI